MESKKSQKTDRSQDYNKGVENGLLGKYGIDVKSEGRGKVIDKQMAGMIAVLLAGGVVYFLLTMAF